MKEHFLLIMILVVGEISTSAQSQEWQLQAQEAEREVTRTHSLDVTTNKTTSLIFPAVIKSVDKGSRDVLVQKARDVSNVLHVKAALENFAETNLTVITADGALHHFTVRYVADPASLTLDMGETESNDAGGAATSRAASRLLFSSEITESQMQQYCEAITGSGRILHLKRKGHDKVALALLGIYIKNDVIFYRVRIRNKSNIDYDVDFLKFFIRDNTRIKRTASQEVESPVLYRAGEAQKVSGKSQSEIVYALQKFTIPDAKHLAIELFEKNGGRHFLLRVKNKSIVRARPL